MSDFTNYKVHFQNSLDFQKVPLLLCCSFFKDRFRQPGFPERLDYCTTSKSLCQQLFSSFLKFFSVVQFTLYTVVWKIIHPIIIFYRFIYPDGYLCIRTTTESASGVIGNNPSQRNTFAYVATSSSLNTTLTLSKASFIGTSI